MILVTGATGRTGSEVVRRLVELGAPTRALVRSTANCVALRSLWPTIELVSGDLDDPASLAKVIDGVRCVFLITPAGPRQVGLETNAIEAARRRSGIRIVKLSWTGAAHDTPVPFGQWHYEIEQHLRVSGLPFTIVRAATFMQHLVGELFASSIRSEGIFYAAAGNGRIGLVDTRDVAAVSAAVLTQNGHEGRVYSATGPNALTLTQVAAAVSRSIGRTVRYADVSSAEVARRLRANGTEPWFARAIVTLFELYREGGGAFVTGDVRSVTGRNPIDIGRFAHDYRGAFTCG